MLALERIFGIKAAASFLYAINTGRKRGIYDEELAEKIEGDGDIFKSGAYHAGELKRLIDRNVNIAIDRAKAIRDGRFEIAPREDSVCRWCELHIVCGK